MLLLEAEGKSLLTGHAQNLYSKIFPYSQFNLWPWGITYTPVCSLAYCFKGFTIYKGNFYLMSFHDRGSNLETKSVYSKQDNSLHLLPSHSVCLQTDHSSISGCTILVSFKLINNQLYTSHSYFSLEHALQLPPPGNLLFLWQQTLQAGTLLNFTFIQSYSDIRSSAPVPSSLFSGSHSAQERITVMYELVTVDELSCFHGQPKNPLFSFSSCKHLAATSPANCSHFQHAVSYSRTFHSFLQQQAAGWQTNTRKTGD